MKKIVLISATILLVSCQPNTQPSLPTTPPKEEAIILRIVDGDTVTVLLKGKMEYIRIVGIDAPEKDECFGDQATEKMRELAEGKRAILESKIDENRDKYDRLLRYLSVDEIDIGGQMIYSGFARNYPLFPHPRSEIYKELEHRAQESNLGLWGECN
ncbi:thermonuclease family protein [Patescibacteria group bacterium]|nr:thermonuclease family protein [Patescibacteria group bacterium]